MLRAVDRRLRWRTWVGSSFGGAGGSHLRRRARTCGSPDARSWLERSEWSSDRRHGGCRRGGTAQKVGIAYSRRGMSCYYDVLARTRQRDGSVAGSEISLGLTHVGRTSPRRSRPVTSSMVIPIHRFFGPGAHGSTFTPDSPRPARCWTDHGRRRARPRSTPSGSGRRTCPLRRPRERRRCRRSAVRVRAEHDRVLEGGVVDDADHRRGGIDDEPPDVLGREQRQTGRTIELEQLGGTSGLGHGHSSLARATSGRGPPHASSSTTWKRRPLIWRGSIRTKWCLGAECQGNNGRSSASKSSSI